MLTTMQSCIYCGVSKPTFLKQKVPYSNGKKKGWKLYNPKDLDTYFPNAPKIMPKQEMKDIAPSLMPPIELIIEDHQASFSSILTKVKELQGERYEPNIAASLIEDLVKASVVAAYYFEQIQVKPDSKDLFSMYRQSVDLKMNLSKRLGL